MFLAIVAATSRTSRHVTPTGLAALSTFAVIPTVVWGLVAGTVAAWFGHRYASGNDADGYEVAVLSDATCPRCDHVITLAEAAPVRSSAGNCVYREQVIAADRERVLIESENLSPVKKMLITLYAPGDLQSLYVIERRAPGLWNFYSLTRTRMASSMLPTGSEASYINRSVAFFRHVAGIPTDQEPPAAR